MKVADVKEAMVTGMELNFEDIDAIANNPEPSAFEKYDYRLGASLRRAGARNDLLR